MGALLKAPKAGTILYCYVTDTAYGTYETKVLVTEGGSIRTLAYQHAATGRIFHLGALFPPFQITDPSEWKRFSTTPTLKW